MNKIYVLFFLITFNITFSQVTWGIKGGAVRTNVISVHGHSLSRIGMELGVVAAISLDNEGGADCCRWQMKNRFYLQVELNYLNHGENNNPDGYLYNYVEYIPSNYESKYYINYLTLPVMLKYYLFKSENSIFLEAGPQIGFVISKNTTSTDPLGAYYTRIEGGDTVNQLDFSVGAGGGVSWRRQLEAGLRINYGFSDVYPLARFDVDVGQNNTITFAATLTYFFGGGRY